MQITQQGGLNGLKVIAESLAKSYGYTIRWNKKLRHGEHAYGVLYSEDKEPFFQFNLFEKSTNRFCANGWPHTPEETEFGKALFKKFEKHHYCTCELILQYLEVDTPKSGNKLSFWKRCLMKISKL